MSQATKHECTVAAEPHFLQQPEGSSLLIERVRVLTRSRHYQLLGKIKSSYSQFPRMEVAMPVNQQ